MAIIHYYRTPALSDSQIASLVAQVNAAFVAEYTAAISGIKAESCYNVNITRDLTSEEQSRLEYCLRETFEPELLTKQTQLDAKQGTIVEVGPRMTFTTAFSSNAVAIMHACNVDAITRLERSRRYQLISEKPLPKHIVDYFAALVHDRMTEQVYPETLTSFDSGASPQPVFLVPVLKEGKAAIEKVNGEMGLAFDERDIEFYTNLFKDVIKRDPTSVELFDMAQSNSEHSRHWFFRGIMVIDNKKMPLTLFDIVKAPFKAHPNNALVAFSDNSCAQQGYKISTLMPQHPGQPGPLVKKDKVEYDITFTAETHNFPTAVAPFAGAETGTGGRLRDQHATGKGSLVIAGTAAYCVGNLHIPNYSQPWETPYKYPSNLASPLDILIQASNGASDYGNKFGEPLICGFTRSFGQRTPEGELREWIKPIMFSGGVGQMDKMHLKKAHAQKGMCVIKLGGPAYRIGCGGGAASSMAHGDNKEELDFNAVQRGDAQMENRTNRVIRACVELQGANPIVSIHDQGAGGSGNVLKEISDPEGADIDIRKFISGDPTLSALELWGAEYQENDALLVQPKDLPLFTSICERENSPFSCVGHITGSKKIVVHDGKDTPVDLELVHVLGDLPPKTFNMVRKPLHRVPFSPEPLLKLTPGPQQFSAALDRVLRLVSVGSKRFLTTKVDRSVSGLVAQQQCVGPLQLTMANMAVVAQSHFGVTGAATSIGENPIRGLIDPAAMARMCVAEALTNIMWVVVSKMTDIKCAGNWMWPAKLEGEGPKVYDAALAMRDIMLDLQIALVTGKDSLSMSARGTNPETNKPEVVKAPGALVISACVSVPDVTKKVTPDLKPEVGSSLYFVPISDKMRMGASALAQVFNQVGDSVPDVDGKEGVSKLASAFAAVQELISHKLITAGHDRSDGGLLVTIIEMAIAGNVGVDLDIKSEQAVGKEIDYMFNEELGFVVQVPASHVAQAEKVIASHKLHAVKLGVVAPHDRISIRLNGNVIVDTPVPEARDLWESTSFQLEMLQANPQCVKQEMAGLKSRTRPPFQLPASFVPAPTADAILVAKNKPRIAIIREQGSNGDREMTSSFFQAGFETWDVTMLDLMSGRCKLDQFQGITFVGGFSYGDVLDSAKGWAATIKFNAVLETGFKQFFARPDTFSLSVCNGCQLTSLLCGVFLADEETKYPRFIHNASGRFESRYVSLKINKSPAIMLQGMEGATLGCWSAHGEGRAHFPDAAVYVTEDILLTEPIISFTVVEEKGLVPLQYVDDQNNATEVYPFNPNGSIHGIAGLCSPDGRHLAMMPHPERCTQLCQLPYVPPEWNTLQSAPRLRMFQNARQWVEKMRK